MNIYQSLLNIQRNLPPRPMLIGRAIELLCVHRLIVAIDDLTTPIDLWNTFDVRENDQAPAGKVILIQKTTNDPFDSSTNTSIIDVEALYGKTVDEMRAWVSKTGGVS